MAARSAASETGDPLLLTPGPLTTSKSVKEVMVHDWGSRDATFIRINQSVLTTLVEIIGGGSDFVTVPMQGSGTFAVEAMLTTFIPRNGKVLILINGAYGQRAKKICEIAGRAVAVHETPEDTPPDLAAVEAHAQERSGDHACVLRSLRDDVRHPQSDREDRRDRRAPRQALPDRFHERVRRAAARGQEHHVRRGRGLVEQMHRGRSGPWLRDRPQERRWKRPKAMRPRWCSTCTISGANFEKTGQYRFTPPIHVIVAFHQALEEFRAEGGVAGRGGRYADNCKILIEGMSALGFEPLLPKALQAPIIVTFRMPADKAFVFQTFYDKLKERGYVIYPGKLTVADSFRIGCIGRLNADHMRGALAAIREILDEMGVRSLKAAA